ncbi:hypothetical protein HBB16_13185 [Pseudonocardia sp. MCCB 268]|nr:hypothetical protein [Pseudonocardia cytotoxica]
MIGLLPTYAVIVGWPRRSCWTLMRVLQGISVGGQWAGRRSWPWRTPRRNRRALQWAIPQLGVVVGMVGGTLAVHQRDHPRAVRRVGVAIPFLLTVLMFPVAIFPPLRGGLPEFPTG